MHHSQKDYRGEQALFQVPNGLNNKKQESRMGYKGLYITFHMNSFTKNREFYL